jgi:hypothetical protein
MIEQIKQALEKATPGPWVISPDKCINGLIDIHARYGLTAQTDHMDNAHLIANTPTWLRYLIGEVERLQYERGLLKLTLHTEIQKENKELQKALKLILETPQGEWQATTGQGHAECLKIARQALQSIQGGNTQ